MAISRHQLARFRPSPSFVLLAALLFILWVAGGASRENVSGQIISRAAAWVAIMLTVLFTRGPRIKEARGTAMLLLAAIILCVVQLIPLPPNLWHALPGRAAFADPLISPPGLWRPMSLVPGATLNALLSLVVPIAILLLTTSINDDQKRWLPATILAVIASSLFIGLIQVTGTRIANPLVNGTPGAIDGLIANRNHYALLLSFGLLMTPVWAVGYSGRSRNRAPAALGFVVLLVLIILATGSRAGLVLGGLALALGLGLSRRGLKTAFQRYPRWVFPTVSVGLIAMLAIFVLASIATDRAVSIDRLLDQDAGQDMRGRGLPVVLAIIRTYFPFGTGMGSFDPIFRMHEPFTLLKPTYFNHAHNDFLEIVLNGGLPGLLLLLVALGWWGWKSLAAWRGDAAHVLPRLGSAMLLLILIASATDYPARTPIIMALATIAAIWLEGTAGSTDGKGSLPLTERHL